MRAWQEIKKWKKKDGWYINPATGNKYCRVSDTARIADDVEMGSWVRVGDYVTICQGSSVGDGSWLHNGVCVAAGARLADEVRLNCGVYVDRCAQLGIGVHLDECVFLAERVRLGDGVGIPVYQTDGWRMHWHKPGYIACGCLAEPFGWWFEHRRSLAEQHHIPPDEQERYAWYVEQIIAWEKVMGDKIGWIRQDRTDG